MKYTKQKAIETIAAYKDNTAYFGYDDLNGKRVFLKQADVYDMLKNRMQFGDAESRVIIAALVLAGAKFE